MPHAVRKTGSKSKPWAIVNRQTGKIVGHSRSKRKAQISASIRDSADRK
jgi:hypothetical protein